MRRTLPTLALLLTLATTARAAETLFDNDWRFTKGDPQNAKDPATSDKDWRQLDLPHDWSIEGPYDQNAITLRGGGYLPAGIAWYRKTFTLPPDAKGKSIALDFDGVMANSEVFLNGQSIIKRPYGFSSFRANLTGKLKDGENVIAVRVDDSIQPASRSFTGAGIYRHTHLVINDPIHIDHWATHITTPEVKGEQATVHIATTLINDSPAAADASLEIVLTDPDKKEVARFTIPAQSVAFGQTHAFEKDLTIDRPDMWDINHPALYTATLTVKSGTQPLDSETTTFGIRLLEWKPATGFWLNGNNLKILGVCLHADGGAVGAAVPASIWQRRIAAMKALGANAVRTAHNPSDPVFLNLCDQMGMLVMEETFDTWTAAKPNGEKGYNLLFNQWYEADTRDMVLRDRNHPSIILWSAGNEIRDNLTAAAGRNHFIAQRDIYHNLDGTRPVTMALFRPAGAGVYAKGSFADLMDVVGQNYAENELVAAYNQDPTRKVLGTENRQDAGAWRALRDNPFMAGQFLWTGIDYLGESDWPYISRYNGLVDRTGLIHAHGYERKSWWSKEPNVTIVRQEGTIPTMGTLTTFANMVHDWTPSKPNEQANIEVYSNCDTVELFLNDKSLGSKPINTNATARTWKIPFQPGTLKAIAKNKGETVATDELKTAGPPTTISAISDRKQITPGFEDVAIINVNLLDKDGTLNLRATDTVSFKLTGPAKIIAVDNGDVASHEQYQATERHLHEGHAIAIIRATAPGTITVTTSAKNLPDTTTTIEAVPAH